MSFIYVIAASDDGPVKIGLTSVSGEARLKQLQTGHPEKLKLYYTEEFPDNRVHMIEKTIHKEIKHHKSHGEWFKLPVDKAILEVKFALIRHGGDET